MVPAVSIIVPAHNEEALLEPTLRAIAASADALGEPYEVLVVDDGSTDRTAEVARAQGAKVVTVDVRHIAAARNAGARAARGSLLIFVDADTLVTPAVVKGAVAAMRAGAVGGGAAAVFDEATPWWANIAILVIAGFMRQVGWAAGCFFFARRGPFEAAAGFDERYFASEEIHLSRALKRQGRMVILRDAVTTSGRKADTYSLGQTFWLWLRLARPGSLKRRDRLGFWYDRGAADRKSR